MVQLGATSGLFRCSSGCLTIKLLFGYHALKKTATVPAPLLDKLLVAHSFKASAATYEDNATVQRQISRQLISRLHDHDIGGFGRVLEIGCCTGILTELLVSQFALDTLYLNDIVEEFCSATSHRIAGRVQQLHILPGDIEQSSLPTELDMVISSATFQWMTDLPTLLTRIHLALCDNGYVVFSIFGPGTMGEIAALTGRSLSYHRPEIIKQMVADRFRLISQHSETTQLYFPGVREVLQHIRKTGVGGLGSSPVLKGKFKEFSRQYRSRFACEHGFPVTYASTFVVAQKRQ